MRINQIIANLSDEAKSALLFEVDKKLSENRLLDYVPYPKQLAFHEAGADLAVRERILVAGNQCGKSLSASMETAMHLTGMYPDWWPGARWDYAVSGWGASITSQGTRDTVQRLLLGPPGNWGTGSIPKSAIVEIKRATHGVADAVEIITVKHVSSGISRITIKTYDQGRERWQGETLDFCWFDEEPPMDIYIEGLTRTNATQGVVWLTFTPLLGMSEVVKRFLVDKKSGTHTTQMSIDDAGHYTPAQRAIIIDSYPEYQREARANGVPVMGSGLIFPVTDNQIMIDPFVIPDHWPKIIGIDFGWDHPTAATLLAWDRDVDCIYVIAEYRQREAVPAIVSASIKPWGDWIPVAWPHDGLQHDTGSGRTLADMYRQHGLAMLPEKATHIDGSNGVEAGIQDMLERMLSGRWKIFSSCPMWLDERRMYHRENGLIVKQMDDLISASRYAKMMIRKAKIKQNSIHTIEPFRASDSGAGY